ncbi:hypothetical protein ACGP04_12830 [Piscirickettsia salmonis]|uniref:hypothetical protein n=1 Tax=Piscirickettsia salmonis TaxID=1238 RepID=UPI0026CEF6D4
MMDRVTVRDALELTPHEQGILQLPRINMLISRGILNINLVFRFNEDALQFFEAINDDIVERMLNGDLNLDDIFGIQEEIGEGQANDLNRAQSTHTASVHRSISESAQKLMALYGGDLTDQVLVSIFKDVKAYLDTLDEGSKTTAAKSAFRRLSAANDSFIDPVSNVSTKQMLALAWIAIHDESKCLGTLEDAQVLFVDGLFEMQRGYNLSPTGVDLGGRDNPICAAGTFNKLIEKLQGVHPSCKVLFISRELASLKLKRVAVEESADYLNNIPLETTKDLESFNDLLGQINEDGLRAVHGPQSVYDHIKDKVSERMFEEFSPLYRGKDDPNFTEMVDGGEWAELPKVEIQQRLSLLPAYQDYCSRHILVSPTLLFQQMANRVLWENRNDSAEHRQAFDAKFGMLLAKDHGFDIV